MVGRLSEGARRIAAKAVRRSRTAKHKAKLEKAFAEIEAKRAQGYTPVPMPGGQVLMIPPAEGKPEPRKRLN